VLTGMFVGYALLASRLDRIWVTGPMFFLVLGAALGRGGLDLLPSVATYPPIELLAEATLAILLFTEASTIDVRQARDEAGLAERLLLVGLPLTVVLGTIAAKLLFPELPWAAAALIGSILAPTDLALGLPVVMDPDVPVRVRRLIEVESGLNDGMVTPLVTLFLALAVSDEGAAPRHFVLDAVGEMGIAVVVAAVVGLLGGAVFVWARRRGWSSPQSEELGVFALAGLSYAGSVAVGGNGFVAAFLAGLLFGVGRAEIIHAPIEFTETTALFLSYIVWGLFGATIVGPVLANGVDLAVVGYAVLSLTVVRMAPVALALRGTGLQRRTVAFVGWFGPRGLASAVFTFVALEEFARYDAGPLAGTVTAVAAWTILLSVIAHGLTATPLSTSYGRRMAEANPDLPELRPAPEPHARRRRPREG